MFNNIVSKKISTFFYLQVIGHRMKKCLLSDDLHKSIMDWHLFRDIIFFDANKLEKEKRESIIYNHRNEYAWNIVRRNRKGKKWNNVQWTMYIILKLKFFDELPYECWGRYLNLKLRLFMLTYLWLLSASAKSVCEFFIYDHCVRQRWMFCMLTNWRIISV